ncbi:MAG: hypothetical protein ACOC3D_04050, partial [Pseudomonadota bacterium]
QPPVWGATTTGVWIGEASAVTVVLAVLALIMPPHAAAAVPAKPRTVKAKAKAIIRTSVPSMTVA